MNNFFSRYWFLLVFLFLIGLSWFGRKNVIDWNETYARRDKIPYGTFLLYEQLPHLFPDQEVYENRRPFSEWLNTTGNNSNLIILGTELEFGEVDEDLLLDFAHRGNDIFIANDFVSDAIYNTLGLDDMITMDWNTDTISKLVLVNPAYKKDTALVHGLESYTFFRSDGSVDIKVLGIDTRNGNPNFIKVPYGRGNFYLHLAPQLFTNIHFKESSQYAARCLSYLPVRHTYWDEYYKPMNRTEATQTDLIQSNESLRIAWKLLLYGSILGLFFFAKRRQRAVRIIPEPQNKSLEYIETMGDLYLNEADNLNMAKKKIRYFYHNVQLQYMLRENDTDFWEHLRQKSGVEEKTMNKIKEMILALPKFNAVSPEFLLRLNNLLEDFYAQSGKYPRSE